MKDLFVTLNSSRESKVGSVEYKVMFAYLLFNKVVIVV